MNKLPKITVLMPVYNCALYVGEAIDSVLNQTFTDYEFLIIDDASTDDTVSIINSYTDPRIKLIEKPENTGYTKSLNFGLSIAKGEYIARMDGDDISMPQRFAKQVVFMDGHPEVVALGTRYSFINTRRIKKVPIKNEDIKNALLKGPCIGHPTVMLRKAIFDENNIKYDSNREPAEDYDLWVRLLRYGKLHNLKDVLLDYRIHETQVSKTRHKQQMESASKTRMVLLENIPHNFTVEERGVLQSILTYKKVNDYNKLLTYSKAKNKVLQANKNRFFTESKLQKYFMEIEKIMFDRYFLKSETYHPHTFIQYVKIRYNFKYELSRSDSFKLMIKSIIMFNKR